ncbi:MAG: TetR family transcriptional regulator [Cumulibacter sp.]
MTNPEDIVDLSTAVPGAPKMVARDRKKAATMRRLQQVALDLFDDRGFDNVTIEEVAEAARVSPRTVYRYFGTKDYLVLRDEYDEQILALAPALLESGDVFAALARAIEVAASSNLMSREDQLAQRRTKLWLETPSLKAAGYLLVDKTSHRLAEIVAASEHNELDFDAAYVVCSAAVMALVASIENWHRNGNQGDLLAVVADALQLVRPAWSR